MVPEEAQECNVTAGVRRLTHDPRPHMVSAPDPRCGLAWEKFAHSDNVLMSLFFYCCICKIIGRGASCCLRFEPTLASTRWLARHGETTRRLLECTWARTPSDQFNQLPQFGTQSQVTQGLSCMITCVSAVCCRKQQKAFAILKHTWTHTHTHTHCHTSEWLLAT